MGLFNLTKLIGMTIRESANDGSDFTNPDADYRRLFLGEDGALHLKDSAGTVTDIGGGGGGAVATDPIWDAKGDIAGGTGADTADNLTVGADYTRLIALSSATTGLAWSGFIGAKAYNSAGASLNDTVILFDSEEFDTNAFHDTSSNTSRMTIPSGLDGKYLISGGCFCNGATRLQLRKNGTTEIRPTGQTLAGAGYTNVQAITTLAATDYVEILPQAGTTRTYGDNSQVGAQSSLCIVFLGP